MAEGEKRFPATPHRRREARQKGQVAKSNEINTVIVLLGGFFILRFFSRFALGNLKEIMEKSFTFIPTQDLSLISIVTFGPPLLVRLLVMVLPFAAALAMVAVLANLLQVGFLSSGFVIKPQLDRINPLNGFKRIFSARLFVDLIKALVKIAIASWVTYAVIRAEIPRITYTLAMEPQQSVHLLGGIILSFVLKTGLALGGLAVLDYIYQRWEYERSLRMSRQDIKEELLRYEGRPEVRQRMRALQRQYAQRRMMEEVAKADVVVTNPTRLAVALRYDPRQDMAPLVLAKGARAVAHKIMEKAREHGVPVIENKPLARALFKLAEIGQVVPVTLFQAVAELLAYLHRAGKSRRKWV